MIRHPGITEVVSQIAGAHLPGWDGAIKCCQSMLFVKGPGMSGQAWHQDERFIPTRDRSLVGVWIALDDATVDNGCLWVMPGSHRNGYLLHRSLKNRSDGFRRALVNHYLNAWSLLPWKPTSTVDGSAIPLLDNRAVVAIGPDPYADRGYTPPPSKVFLRPIDQSWPDTSGLATL